ncbi:hypothetical protein CS022_20190 [Veronia nyctiphanis]|uniref:Protein-ribulosamine 3-kinase n=1 Tax=Veronia nyctiphanis TaxID=1278244 RepID=A0A4Q0YMR7_9GAMM|nr:fructosamine kinase family protein [Veronia nyctiphanis]RXJ71665.1 hypothetical protein CS022_20190 [Veronia nyctiphanis]
MWQSLSLQLSDIIGQSFTIVEKTPVDGGDINECYTITDGTNRFFVKVNDRANLSVFESEAESLRHLAICGEINVPKVVFIGAVKDHAVLVLNFLALKHLDTDSAYQLGRQLAQQHQWGEQLEYGFDIDNYVGTTVQPNNWHRKWNVFFSEQRISWQLQLAAERGIHFGNVDSITGRIKERLSGHQPKPCLLHGDLWLGNTGLSVLGPIFFDPASYWGDRETDVAMTELFGRFPDSFYTGYNEVWPLEHDYAERKEIYNLYHILNHALIFGGQYISDAEDILDALGLN